MSAVDRSVLVVDDSALVREAVKRVLTSLGGWSVSVAGDPVIALRKLREDPPDVVLLDLEMPRMDGITFLRHLMAVDPIPVVVLSSHATAGGETEASLRELGAVEVLCKPEMGMKDFLEGESSTLALALERAIGAPPASASWRSETGTSPASLVLEESDNGAGRPQDLRGSPSAPTRDGSRVVLIGASMGGPGTLREVLSAFPASGPPCLVVQHMMEGYDESFAGRLDEDLPMRVKRAESGDVPEPGLVLVAPGGKQMVLTGSRRRSRVLIEDGPPVRYHRPSIDVLFKSAAKILGDHVVAALLTGIGDDGAEGLLDVKRAGGWTLVQDEATSVAFGMPKAAIDRGAAAEVLALDRIGPRLLDLAGDWSSRSEPRFASASRSEGESR